MTAGKTALTTAAVAVLLLSAMRIVFGRIVGVEVLLAGAVVAAVAAAVVVVASLLLMAVLTLLLMPLVLSIMLVVVPVLPRRPVVRDASLCVHRRACSWMCA